MNIKHTHTNRMFTWAPLMVKVNFVKKNTKALQYNLSMFEVYKSKTERKREYSHQVKPLLSIIYIVNNIRYIVVHVSPSQQQQRQGGSRIGETVKFTNRIG